MQTVDLAKIQACFFGLNFWESQALIQSLSELITRFGSTSPEGKTLIEVQGLLDDVTLYAETIRMHEGIITEAIAGTEGGPRVAQRPRPRHRNKNTVKKGKNPKR